MLLEELESSTSEGEEDNGSNGGPLFVWGRGKCFYGGGVGWNMLEGLIWIV